MTLRLSLWLHAVLAPVCLALICLAAQPGVAAAQTTAPTVASVIDRYHQWKKGEAQSATAARAAHLHDRVITSTSAYVPSSRTSDRAHQSNANA